jgi:AraC family transcriptional regulator, regulatory protein of adaptative response / methylated-DNA-[protein]-cysteine methyltransferase
LQNSIQPTKVRWRTVVRRDRTRDGQFFYAVRTTGIFCRPSCASRLPLRKNVEFFETTGDAVIAGYRPCRRCRPSGTDPRHQSARLVVRACRRLENIDQTARSADIADKVGLSRPYFQRLFKRQMGVTPQQYRRRIRAERAKRELMDAPSVTRAVYAAGYSSSSRFYAGPARELGMPARAARTGAPDQPIHYAVRACSLGRVLIAWTDRGVCEVAFGDSEDVVAQVLLRRFPKAIIEQTAAHPWVNAVLAAVERPRAVDIPLDVQGTAFQQRVWRELQKIPAGETRTYTEIARAVGTPQSARAVARACATNPAAVLIPCHRVVRNDGELAGYRWGIRRKKELLQLERND